MPSPSSHRFLLLATSASLGALVLPFAASATTPPNPAGPSTKQTEELPATQQPGSKFGSAVAISSSLIVVGAPDETIGKAKQVGKVFIFTKPAKGWRLEKPVATLTEAKGKSLDGFGTSVAVSGNTIAVGAPGHVVGSGQGVVDVFKKPKKGWKTTTTATAKQLTVATGTKVDELGATLSMTSTTIVAGAPGRTEHGVAKAGAVEVFVKPGSGWKSGHQKAELTATTPTGYDAFGQSVGVSGTTIVAGDRNGNDYAGDVDLYSQPASGWKSEKPTRQLALDYPTSGDQLGYSVAIAGNDVIAGAPGYEEQRGAAFFFVKPTTGWGTSAMPLTQSAATIPIGGTVNDKYGASVAINSGLALVGASGLPVNSSLQVGGVYGYVPGVGGWATPARSGEYTATYGESTDELGSSLALNGTTFATGAPTRGGNYGAVYVFTRSAS